MVRLDHIGRRGLALLLLGAAWCGTARAETGAPPPEGHTRAIAARRAATPPVIDGVLDDRSWERAAVAEAFWVSDRQQPPTDQTRVIVLYDDRALYFAFTCLDSRPDLIRAAQIIHDSAPGLDDHVTIELDPFHNHRSFSRFTVTARGTRSEASADGRARQLRGKGLWRAAATRTPFGWIAEFEIPLEMLDFDPGADTFGVNFSRYQNRTRERSEWANLTPRRLPEEAGHLTGLRLSDAANGRAVTAVQYVSAGAGGTGNRHRAGAVSSGIDLRYQARGSVTSVISARPDFSGTDVEVPGIGFSHTEKFVSDHRPFFQEGAAQFGEREVFHSGRIDDFDLGVKTFGRVDDYHVAALVTTDAGAGRTDYVGRVAREVGPTFNLSAMLAGTDRETLHSDTVQVRAGGRIGRHVRVDGNLARTSGNGAAAGARRRGELGYETSHWYSGAWVDHTDPEYLPASGFIAADVIGTTGRGAYGGHNRAFDDLWVRRADASVSYEVRDTTGGLRQRETTSVYAGAETAANVRLNAGMTIGSYRPRGTDPQWLDAANDDRFYLTSAFYESPTGQFGYGAQYSWGIAGEQAYNSIAPSAWIVPSSHLSLTYSFERADHDQVQHQHVVAGTWAITSAQSLSARWVEYDGGYYRLTYRHTLGRGVDAYGAYTSDPYDPGTLNLKVVWSLLPFAQH